MARQIDCLNPFPQQRQEADELKIIAEALFAMKHESLIFQGASIPAGSLGVAVRHTVSAIQAPFVLNPALLIVPVEQKEKCEAEMRFAVLGIGLNSHAAIAGGLRELTQATMHQPQRPKHR